MLLMMSSAELVGGELQNQIIAVGNFGPRKEGTTLKKRQGC